MDVDFDVEKNIVFEEAWSTLDRRFFDPAFHGKDWDKERTIFAPQIAGAHTPDEMRRLINEMIGELDASHSGIGGPSNPNAPPVAHVGDLGLRFDRAAYEGGKGLVVREVIALGPTDIEGSIKPGARIVSVDGASIGAHDNLDQLLLGKVGRRTVLGVVDAGGHAHEAVVRPRAGAGGGRASLSPVGQRPARLCGQDFRRPGRLCPHPGYVGRIPRPALS